MAERLLDIRNDSLRFQDTSKVPLPGGIVPCLLCTKPMLMLPFIGEPDQTCPDCQATYSDTAKVICRKCRITIGRVPCRVLDNGYYIRPRSVLHSNCCNVCRPGLSESTIEEIEQWCRTIRPKKIILSASR